MKKIIVACQTLQDEVEAVLKQQGQDIPIVWIPSGLHNVPSTLTAKLQETLDALEPTDLVLLAMAYCGNSVQGVKTGNYQLVIPRMDDCISLLLGKVKAHEDTYKGHYFLTAGWIRGERNLVVEYQHVLEKYGEKRGKMIYKTMLRHYTHIAMLNSGCFDTAPTEEEVRRTADLLGMQYREVAADLTLLRQLLEGPWPNSLFLTVPPHTEITSQMLTLANQ